MKKGLPYTLIAALVAILVMGCRSSRSQGSPVSTESVSNQVRTQYVQTSEALVRPRPVPVLNQDSSLSDYLAYAALNNPGLEAAFHRWKAALERVPQVRSLPDPRFTYGYYIQEVETRVGPQEHQFALAQTFPWFGKLKLQGEVATEAAREAEQAFTGVKLRLFYRVKNAYYHYYYLKRALEVTGDNIELLKHLERVAEAKLRGGAALAAVTKVQVEIGQLEDRRGTLLDMRRPIVARLNAALNRRETAPLPWPQEIRGEQVVMDEPSLLSWLAENNPEIRGLSFAIAKEERAMARARKDFYPDFTLGLGYIVTGDALIPNTVESGKDPLLATVTMNLPLWLGKYRAGVREARARQVAAERARVDRENELGSELQLALYEFRDAERKIDLYRDTLLPLARSALNVTEQSYTAGQGDFLDLVDAQRVLLEFELEYERALSRREQRLAAIEMLVGRELPRQGEKDPNQPTKLEDQKS
jgi:outer membrane protein TolC